MESWIDYNNNGKWVKLMNTKITEIGVTQVENVMVKKIK